MAERARVFWLRAESVHRWVWGDVGKGALEMLWWGDRYLSKECNERHPLEPADGLGLWSVII